jgi:hypothetical protein
MLESLEKQLEQIQSAQATTVSESLELAEADDLREQLDRIEASAATVEERTGQIQRDVEDLGR